jgi:hypothetical protein
MRDVVYAPAGETRAGASAPRDQRRHHQHRGEADRRCHEWENQHQQAGQADAGQLMGQKSVRAAEPPQEGERHRQHHEVVGVEIRRRQHGAGGERRGFDFIVGAAAPQRRDGAGGGERDQGLHAPGQRLRPAERAHQAEGGLQFAKVGPAVGQERPRGVTDIGDERSPSLGAERPPMTPPPSTRRQCRPQ